MRKIFFLIFITIFLGLRPSATVISTTDLTFFPKTITSKETKNIASLKIKDIQKMLGRKLTLKEKIGLLILRPKFRHRSKENNHGGQTAFIIALVSLGFFLLAFIASPLILGSFIGAILAIVLGSMAKKKDPSDRKAYAAVLLGWITLGALVLLSVLAVIAWAAFWNAF